VCLQTWAVEAMVSFSANPQDDKEFEILQILGGGFREKKEQVQMYRYRYCVQKTTSPLGSVAEIHREWQQSDSYLEVIT
jgi:hypothetical protein